MDSILHVVLWYTNCGVGHRHLSRPWHCLSGRHLRPSAPWLHDRRPIGDSTGIDQGVLQTPLDEMGHRHHASVGIYWIDNQRRIQCLISHLAYDQVNFPQGKCIFVKRWYYNLFSMIRLDKVIDSSVGVVLTESPLKALKLTTWFSLMLHWIGCWYYSFTQSDGFGGPFLPSENDHFGINYLRAIIFALKVIAWKGPSNFPQTLRHLQFTNACVLAGLFISAYM